MKPSAEFSLGLGSIDPYSVDPCNVRGKTFKLIRGEDNEEKTAVIDAETQKTVAVLRRELQREKLRSFVDLTKQRAKIVTVVAGGGGNSTTTEANELPKQQKQQPVTATVVNSSRMELPVKIKTKNSFEVAIAKVQSKLLHSSVSDYLSFSLSLIVPPSYFLRCQLFFSFYI